MKKRLVINDIKNNKLLAFTTGLFMAVSAFLFALCTLLSVNLLGAVDHLMKTAQTPDFLQMHTGEIDEREIEAFAGENQAVDCVQILRFLNLENASISLNGHSLGDSTQDNGVSVQSPQFDFLVDMNDQAIQVQEGEIYVPVCYDQEYGLEIGEEARIGGQNLTIAGFLRDSQMNSMMASSKRFLVNEADYKRLAAVGSEEYLIEFLLEEGADVNVFSGEYVKAGLPVNGPAITKPLIRLMNALSDGMVVLVLLLVSIVMLLIAMLCIRFTLLATLEEDQREIGMMKAVGIGRKDLRRIYLTKYMVLSAAGAAIGLLAAYLGQEPLQKKMQELYGTAENSGPAFLLAAVGVALTEGILLCSIVQTLKRTEKMSAVEALTGRQKEMTAKSSKKGRSRRGRKHRLSLPEGFSQYACVLLVIAAGVFLMVVPQNIYSTISSPEFVTHMGIGGGEICMDIRQTEDILEQTLQLKEELKKDSRVEAYTSLVTKSFRIFMPDGSETSLAVELGDHTAFPVAYAAGTAPTGASEIALSTLWAEEAGVTVGDTVLLLTGGKEQPFTVCGIYSDITDGGKTAKAAFTDEGAPIMWSVLYVSLRDGTAQEQWIADYEQKLAADGVNGKIVNVADYMKDTYGQTMERIRTASVLAALLSAGIVVTVVFLFVRLLLARDRYEVSLKKAIGLTGNEIKRQYYRKYLLLGLLGALSGVLSGNLLGEGLAGSMLGMLGASGFSFLIDGTEIYLVIPLLAVAIVMAAAAAGLRKINTIQAYECCSSRD